MGTPLPFDAGWIARVDRYLRKQVVRVQQQLAANALRYFENFRYHGLPGNLNAWSLGYSYWYVTHWRVWRDEPKVEGTSNGRSMHNETPFHYGSGMPEPISGDAALDKVTDGKVAFGHKTFVTNSVGYGRWLNDGGFFRGTFVTDIMGLPTIPLHFVEQCMDGMTRTWKRVATRVREANSSI